MLSVDFAHIKANMYVVAVIFKNSLPSVGYFPYYRKVNTLDCVIEENVVLNI